MWVHQGSYALGKNWNVIEFSNFIFPAQKAIYLNNLIKINGKQKEIKSVFENFHEK